MSEKQQIVKARTNGHGETASVSPRKCNACAHCLKVCQFDAIHICFDPEIGDGRARVDAAQCTGCGSCVQECPQKALTLEIV